MKTGRELLKSFEPEVQEKIINNLTPMHGKLSSDIYLDDTYKDMTGFLSSAFISSISLKDFSIS
jgi:hypothetical protein